MSLCRLSSRLFGRSVLFNAIRSSSGGHGGPVDVDHEPRVNLESFDQQLKGIKHKEPTKAELDALGHVVGDHRYEMLEKLRGTADPFDISVQKYDDLKAKQGAKAGTLKSPILVPSAAGNRLIGCVCEEDNCYINWMPLMSGEKKKCDCGIYFQLVDIEHIEPAHH